MAADLERIKQMLGYYEQHKMEVKTNENKHNLNNSVKAFVILLANGWVSFCSYHNFQFVNSR